MIAKLREDLVGAAGGAQLHGAEVEGQPDGGRPVARGRRSALEQRLADLVEDAELLGDRNELGGGNPAQR